MATAWAVIGAILQCSAQNKDWMFCGKHQVAPTSMVHLLMITARVFTGIGTGVLNAITPVWATETAEHTSRGQFVSIEFTLNIFGVVVAYWIE